MSPVLKYVLVVLASNTTQQQLKDIQPDFVKLKSAFNNEQGTGVIVTCAGQM